MKPFISIKLPVLITAALCSATLAVSAASNDSTSTSSSTSSNGSLNRRAEMPSNSMLKHGDRSFVEKAAKSNLEEIAISRVAAERATNPQVRDFAQMMVSDHTGASSELMSLASTKGLTLPTKDIDVDKWQNRSAKSFDEEYMEKMVSDHKDTVDLFEKEAKKGDDAELTAFANRTLPTLQAHLTKAQDIRKSLK